MMVMMMMMGTLGQRRCCRRQQRLFWILWLSITLPSLAEGFLLLYHPYSSSSQQQQVPSLPQHTTGRISASSSSTLLLLATKRKAESSGGGGGFGVQKTVAPKKKKKKTNKTKQKKTAPAAVADDDYSIFPALEPSVQNTLVAARDDDRTMDDEIYQRLAQIYGFPDFNYETVAEPAEDTTAAPLDLTSLLTVTDDDENDDDDDDDDAPALMTALDQLPPFESIRVLHVDPLVLAVDHFLTPAECDAYVQLSSGNDDDDDDDGDSVLQSRSPTVGKDAAAQAQRTSTTFYHTFASVPALMSKASRLLGITKELQRWEEPQTVCYQRSEQFTWHLDALGPAEANNGQRVATLLVYLADMPEGGATLFRDLGGTDQTYLTVQPVKGTALLFFPAAGGIPAKPVDIRTLHCGQAVPTTATAPKWIAQLWLREQGAVYQPTAPTPENLQTEGIPATERYCAAFNDSIN